MGRLSDSLRQLGYRGTVQRDVILEAVESIDGHISMDDLYQRVHERFPQVNLSTIYRTMELLEEVGLVRHAHFHDGVTKWHRADEIVHQHLVCERCHSETDLDLGLVDPLTSEIRDHYGFAANLTHFVITGVCRDCLAKEPAAAS
jgi:Fur family ferric uptake transcriptional regulator